MAEDDPVEPKLQLPARTAKPPPVRFPIAIAVVAVLVVGIGLSARWWLPLFQSTPPASPAETAAAPAETAPPVEASPPTPPPTEAPVNTELADRVDRLQSEIEALQHAPRPQPPPGVDPQALAALDANVEALQSRLAAVEKAQAEHRTEARNQQALVLATAQIEAALAGSTPYRDAVELIRGSAGDDAAVSADLAVLEAHAASGLPSRVSLAQDLALLPGRLAEPAPAPEGASYSERLWDRVTGIVRIRRVDSDAAHPAGPPGPDRIVDQAEALLAGGDLAGAVDVVKGLDGEAAHLASPWLDAATARLAAERAAASLSATLTKRLAGPGTE